MTITVRFLGLELLHIELATDPPHDEARDLSGGELSGRDLDSGSPDLHLGFTNGREGA